MAQPNTNKVTAPVSRIRLWYALLIIVVAIFGVRLFYLQVIRYDYYRKAALSDQLKQYQIPASRGLIRAHDGAATLPIVLNQTLYTLYADPVYIKNATEVADKIIPIIGGKADDYTKSLTAKHTRYAILAKKLSADQQRKIIALKYPGLGTVAQDYRIYPQATLAAQLLGFVNNDGVGKYGIEQALNGELNGTPGQLKAITDVRGVPLASSRNNIEIAPKDGNDVVLTIDLAMQQQLETILKKGQDHAMAESASALIIDVKTGAVKAMANVPTYDPSQYYKVENGDTFQNAAVSKPIEVGSIMKTLTTVAALDKGVIKPDTTYADPASWVVDGFRIKNVEEDGGAGTRSITDILNLSLNTGATWELMQMGGGEINTKARNTWYDYLTNHYRLGQQTGIEQGYEAAGYVPKPEDNGAAINLTYANMTFGQAMTATPLQMAAALAAVVNGGTYYQPRLVDETISADGTIMKQDPKVLANHIVSAAASQEIVPLMQYSLEHHHLSPAFDQNRYTVGGKTGTAQIAKAGGGYLSDAFNGTYLGFVGGDTPQYVIVVFVQKPKIGGYAGTAAAQPIFGDLAHMLIDNSYIASKTH